MRARVFEATGHVAGDQPDVGGRGCCEKTRNLDPQLGGEFRLFFAIYGRALQAGCQSRVRGAHVVLHRAVAQAVRWGWLVRNPVSNAARPPVARVAISPPGIDDVRAVLAASRKVDLELWCWLQVAIASGARRGEVRAVR